MAIFPLNVSVKEDHPDKVAKLQNVPTRYYVTALELNRITDAISELHRLVLLNTTNKIPVNGKLYVLHKHLNNNDPLKTTTRQNNDIVYNVQWSATEVWQMAMCVDEAKSSDDKTAWNVINPLKQIPLI